MTPFANRYTVIYDACVLYPFMLRDFLMWLALEDIFRAKWSNAIHEEWTNAVLRNHPNLTAERLKRTRQLMDENVRDCLVEDFDHLVPMIVLPDPDDRHVVAAAIKSQANAIITFNLRDFPRSALKQFDIEPIHPDEFVLCQFDLAQSAVLKAVRSQRQNMKNPAMNVQQYLEGLIACGLVQTGARLRMYQEFL